MSELNHAIKSAGVAEVAAACGISPRAVYKWLKKGSLPKTEFYGKTSYAEKIEQLTLGRFAAKRLLAESQAQLLAE
ncbi:MULTISPECIES: helix-turn-helix domain-containing protein [unclassified Enterobacter]|jgi:predicted site-specific integrase-resolvase|uniref:helix-turn-helix transcriptional regulator n=1 Tax=unclassified Enterobacter TaxID=2608935 RepID=UPI0015CBDBF1|nr:MULTISPECIES: helix-turn-helix domain-containing protein [unclassified Enterobacter]MBB3307138.1 putative site-specific integrase-resolvase [Enterobacter sp. Sphag1F]NYI15538.1 putative site-specific integrase-resolvase [Enterobacter sp. Sphag71]